MAFTFGLRVYRPPARGTAVLLLSLAYLAGCGYKGPLYLPGQQPEARRPAAILTPETPADRPVPAEAVPSPK